MKKKILDIESKDRFSKEYPAAAFMLEQFGDAASALLVLAILIEVQKKKSKGETAK